MNKSIFIIITVIISLSSCKKEENKCARKTVKLAKNGVKVVLNTTITLKKAGKIFIGEKVIFIKENIRNHFNNLVKIQIQFPEKTSTKNCRISVNNKKTLKSGGKLSKIWNNNVSKKLGKQIKIKVFCKKSLIKKVKILAYYVK